MAVITKYVVERNGMEKQTFTSKKEADAYDKLLDTAEALGDWLGELELDIPAEQRDELGYQLAAHKETLLKLLKGQPAKPVAKAAKPKEGTAPSVAPKSAA